MEGLRLPPALPLGSGIQSPGLFTHPLDGNPLPLALPSLPSTQTTGTGLRRGCFPLAELDLVLSLRADPLPTCTLASGIGGLAQETRGVGSSQCLLRCPWYYCGPERVPQGWSLGGK